MNELNGKLQYRLSNGSWVDCDERTDEFLNKCVEHYQDKYTRDEVINALNIGQAIRNHKDDWHSKCRIAPAPVETPVIEEFTPDSEEYGY